MMSPEANAAYERFSATLFTATRHLGRPVEGLAGDVAGAYGAALDEARTGEAAWRMFFQLVAALAQALAREAPAPADLVEELRALLRENEDLLARELAFT